MAEEQDRRPDLVVKGLPFESTEKDICDFFNLDSDQVRVLVWKDSGRCKGTAFLLLDGNNDDISRCLDRNEEEFTAGQNARQIRISEYEERTRQPRRPRGRGRGRGGRGQRRGRDRRSDNREPNYEPTPESSREVYVSNIPFEANREDFDDVFGSCGPIEDVTIPTVYSTGRPKGFAFVRFETEDGREKALDLDGCDMNGRKIGVRPNRGRAQRQQREPKRRREGLSEKPANCTTIFVGNLPFETTEDQLQQVFEPFGAVVSARIVVKSWTKQSRGFGYVEFEDTKCVDEAVQQTLVIDDRELRIDFADQLQGE